jgi:putative endonuclease
MPWTVYILHCADGSFYTGITTDLKRRLAAHALGRGGAYTRSRRPVRVVYTERRGDRATALRREAAIRRLSRGEKASLIRRRPVS